MDPNQQEEQKRWKKIYVIVDTDFAMRKNRGAYEEATRKAELWLRSLAEETGGLVFIPRSEEEMTTRAEEIAREIDSQYVVTYTQNGRWRRRPWKSTAASTSPPELLDCMYAPGADMCPGCNESFSEAG